MKAQVAGQLDLFAAEHETQVYKLDRLWDLDRSIVQAGDWWAWRCACGRDVGAEHRAAYSGPIAAERMAWHHKRKHEPWNNPLPGPPVDGWDAKGCK